MNKKHYRKLSVFLIPGMVGLVSFFVLPLAINLWMSFNGFSTDGIQNYQAVIQSRAFQLSVKNTLRLIATGMPITLVIGVGGAFAFRSLFQFNLPGVRILFLLQLLPLVLPSAIITFFIKLVFPYSEAPEVTYLMTGIYIWKNIPYMLLAAFLGLRNIPDDIQDAARLDGANSLQSLHYILLPFLRPYILVGIILACLGVFRIYRESYLLFGKYPDQSIYYIQNYMNNMFDSSGFGQLSAASNLFLICISFLLLACLLFLGRGVKR